MLSDSAEDDALTRRGPSISSPLSPWSNRQPWCRHAGWPPKQATAQWSSDIAARWWQAALDAYDRLPATAGRVASALLRASGGWPWLAPGHDPEELLALLARAATLSEAEPASAARVLPALAVGHCYHADPHGAAGMLDRAEQVAAPVGDRDVPAERWSAGSSPTRGCRPRAVRRSTGLIG